MAMRAGLVIALAVAGVHVASVRAQRRLPENPCDVLTPTQMSNASGLNITSSSRAAAFAKFPGSTAALAGVGADAWLAGGASLHVLVRDADYFAVTTQNYRPESRGVLVRIAQRIVAELTSVAAAHN
jgi:hypothetical protein